MNLACALVFVQLFEAYTELTFRRLTENQSLELSCALRQDPGGLRGLHLYHRGARSQTTLLSVAEGGELRVDPQHRGRLWLRGGLDSQRVNVTMSHLGPRDTGLYMWELSYREEDDGDDPHLTPGAEKVFLLVEGAGTTPCQCSPSYPPLLWAVCAAAGLVVLTLSWLATEKCSRTRRHHRPQAPVPIYEEMARKQQSASAAAASGPQHHPEAPSHLEEDNFPVYANPNIRQPQDNYYACPRQLALRA